MPLRKNVAQHLGFVLAYWACGFLAWLVFTDTLEFWELMFGGGTALLAALGAEAARSADVARFRPRWTWMLEAWRLPAYILRDCAQVLWLAPWTSRHSVLRSVVFEGGAADGHSAACRALTIAFSSMPPNAIVLDIDAAKRVMVQHQMSAAPTPQLAKHLGAKS